MNYKKILRETIDLHVHVGPEIIPRKFDIKGLVASERGKIRGAAVKNHFFPSFVSRANKSKDFLVVGSVVLNVFQGGFNPDIIKAVRLSTDGPMIVWFPTISANYPSKNIKAIIPQEWLGNKKINSNLLTSRSLNIWSAKVGTISKDVVSVLGAIKQCDAILATGHLSWQESVKLVGKARRMGIKKIIITHPIYQKIAMPISVQSKLAVAGCFIECCYSMYSIDKISIALIAKQIKTIGAKRCILSSDVGQKFSLPPSGALSDFMYLLSKNGVTEAELYQMLVINPNYLVSSGCPVVG